MNIYLTAPAILLGGLLLPAGAWAQESANAVPIVQSGSGTELYVRDLPEALRPARPLPAGADNVLMLTQTGNSNLASIAQAGDYNLAQLAVSGNGNTTTLAQQGTRNATDLRLTGNNNPVNMSQDGNNNRYNLDLNSSNTTVELVQQGNGNRVQSTLAGDNRQYGVTQLGNNNELTQREGAATVLPQGYNVEMRGTGIRMTIEQGRALP